MNEFYGYPVHSVLKAKYHNSPKQHFRLLDKFNYNTSILNEVQARVHRKLERETPIQLELWKEDNTMNWKFYNRLLSAREKVEFEDWQSQNADAISELLLDVFYDSLKLSVSLDTLNETFTASLTPTKTHPKLKGVTLTGKHSDYWMAIQLVLFKHLVICNKTDWEKCNMGVNEDWG